MKSYATMCQRYNFEIIDGFPAGCPFAQSPPVYVTLGGMFALARGDVRVTGGNRDSLAALARLRSTCGACAERLQRGPCARRIELLRREVVGDEISPCGEQTSTHWPSGWPTNEQAKGGRP